MDATNSEHRKECICIAAELRVMGYQFPHNRVVVIRDPSRNKSEGGIIIPDQAKPKLSKGTILAFGALVVDEDGKVKPETGLGDAQILDRCVFTKYHPILIELTDSEGKLLYLETMHPSDIYVTWHDARMG